MWQQRARVPVGGVNLSDHGERHINPDEEDKSDSEDEVLRFYHVSKD